MAVPEVSISSRQQLLRDGRFGDSQSILSRVLSFYEKGLTQVASHSETAEHLTEALSSLTAERKLEVLLDPIVRVTLQDALNTIASGNSFNRDDIEPHLETVLRTTKCGRGVLPLTYQSPNTPTLMGVWAPIICWKRHSPENPLQHRFQSLFEERLADAISTKTAELRDPDEEMLETLQDGLQLLQTLLPKFSDNALSHVRLLAIVDRPDKLDEGAYPRENICQNVSTHAIPGTIFVSPTPLRDPWKTAEAIFHEALHKKLSDIVLTRSVFEDEYDTEQASTIKAVWNRSLSWNSNDWPIDRALYALHYYIHIVSFYERVAEKRKDLVEEYGTVGLDDIQGLRRTALDRARYLLKRLQKKRGSLGQDGGELLDWLDSALHDIDPNPPDEDPALSLLLSRYDQETREFGRALDQLFRESPGPGKAVDDSLSEERLEELTAQLLETEIEVASHLLQIAVSGGSHPRLSGQTPSQPNGRDSLSVEDRIRLYRDLRGLVASTLRRMPAAAYSQPVQTSSGEQVEPVEEMERLMQRSYEPLRQLAEEVMDSSHEQP